MQAANGSESSLHSKLATPEPPPSSPAKPNDGDAELDGSGGLETIVVSGAWVSAGGGSVTVIVTNAALPIGDCGGEVASKTSTRAV